MNENDFASQVEGYLNIFGWRWVHFRPARTAEGWRTALSGHKGPPDYYAVRNDRLIFIELKGTTGKLSPEQKEWQDDLTLAGAETYVLYPTDEVEEILK